MASYADLTQTADQRATPTYLLICLCRGGAENAPPTAAHSLPDCRGGSLLPRWASTTIARDGRPHITGSRRCWRSRRSDPPKPAHLAPGTVVTATTLPPGISAPDGHDHHTAFVRSVVEKQHPAPHPLNGGNTMFFPAGLGVGGLGRGAAPAADLRGTAARTSTTHGRTQLVVPRRRRCCATTAVMQVACL